jgi:hypothetical protein
MLAELNDAFDTIEADGAVRVAAADERLADFRR